MTPTLHHRISLGEAAIAQKRAAGEPVPPKWEERLARLKALAGEAGAAPPSPDAGGAAYRAALWAWWGLPETAPLAAFRDALGTLRAAEAACPAAAVQAVLQGAADAWHRETWRCPFCETAGTLHLGETTP